MDAERNSVEERRFHALTLTEKIREQDNCLCLLWPLQTSEEIRNLIIEKNISTSQGPQKNHK